MVTRKCGKCDTVWRSELTHCAFCGHEGVDQSSTSVAVLERPRNGVPKPAAPPAPAPAASLPVPPPVPLSASVPVPAPVPVSASVPLPVAAPRLPSANVPMLFALLGLGAAALLPAGAWLAADRVASVLVFLGVALLTPFAPLAWWTGARYAGSCHVLGFRPALSARLGHAFGIAVTLLLAAEGSALAFLRALDGLRQ